MTEVTITSKYQIVIPEEIREQLGLEPGRKLQALCIGNRFELIPVRDMKDMKGFLPGLDTTVERDPDRL